MNKSKASGYEYERHCAEYLKKKGYTDIRITPGSGDQGIDIICHKSGKKYGFQCKLYSGPVGNKAVQEAYSGAAFYHCDVAAVMTNSSFTKSAIELGHKIGVKLYTNSTSTDSIKQTIRDENWAYERMKDKENEVEQIVTCLNICRTRAKKASKEERPFDFFIYRNGKKIGAVLAPEQTIIDEHIILRLTGLIGRNKTDGVVLAVKRPVSEAVKRLADEMNVDIMTPDDFNRIQDDFFSLLKHPGK